MTTVLPINLQTDRPPTVILTSAATSEKQGPLPAPADVSAKLPALTGIRGIAACWVVGFHIATNLDSALGGFPGRGTIVLRSG